MQESSSLALKHYLMFSVLQSFLTLDMPKEEKIWSKLLVKPEA